MEKFIYSLLLLIVISCTPPSIVGEWKLQKVELKKGVNDRWPDGFTYDLENKDLLRQQLMKERHNEKNSLHVIDSVLQQTERLGLVFRSDSSYKMMHDGIFFPISYAGWFLADDIENNWILKNDTLYLKMMRNDYLGESPFHVMYKVLNLDDDQLQIQELGIQEQRIIGRGMIEIEPKPSTVISFQRN
jgi:hypothetical protein